MKRDISRRWRLVIALTATLWLGGCERYRPLPLAAGEPAAQTLNGPQALVLRAEAAKLSHPILRPVRLDPRAGLSPDEVAVLAVLLNPSLRALRDRRAVTDAQLIQAGLLPNPQLAFDFEAPVGGQTAGTVNAFGLTLSWDATSLISRSARQDKARAQRAAVEMDIAWQEWQTAQAAKSAVYQWVSLQRQFVLARQAEQQMARNITAVRDGVARGAKTARDLAAAQAALLKASEAALQMEKEANQQRLRLAQLLGLSGSADIRLKEGIELPAAFHAPAAEVLLDHLEQRRLDLVALQRGYESQESTVRAAILGQFPRITIGPSVGRDIENVNTVGFALSIELPIFNRNQGTIAAERATRQRLHDEYADRVFQARSDIEMILAGIGYLNRQIAAAAAAEPNLEQLVDEYRKALEAGRVDALTYYAAWSELSASRIKLLTLEGQLAQAVVALELAAGMYEIPHLSESPTTAPALESPDQVRGDRAATPAEATP